MEIRTKFELGQQVYFIVKGKIYCGVIKSVNILSGFDKDFENKKINVTTTYNIWRKRSYKGASSILRLSEVEIFESKEKLIECLLEQN
jgi:hypothetical protein